METLVTARGAGIPTKGTMSTTPEPDLKAAVFTVLEGFTLHHDARKILETAYYAAQPIALTSAPAEPIDMVLHCPECGMQHIDAPEEDEYEDKSGALRMKCDWTNPPHRSHLCHYCEHIWRPSDVPTNGVQAVKTTGKADSPIAPAETPQAAGAIDARERLTDAECDAVIHAVLGKLDSFSWSETTVDTRDAIRVALADTLPAPAGAIDAREQPTDGQIIGWANKALPGWTRRDNDLAYIQVVRAALASREEAPPAAEAEVTRFNPAQDSFATTVQMAGVIALRDEQAAAGAAQTVNKEQVAAFKAGFHLAHTTFATCGDYDACVAAGLRAALAATPSPEAPSAGDWRIDHSAGRPILMFQNCSVIEAKTAEYVLRLIATDQSTEATDNDERVTRAVSELIRLRHCLSYNVSYCGESVGRVKRDVAGWERQGATATKKPLAFSEAGLSRIAAAVKGGAA
jgi:hypothetical protein